MTTTVQRYEFNAPAQRVSQATTVEQSRAIAEVQSAVIVAQQVPRDIQRAVAEMRESCGRMAMASQAFYAVPNRGNGASVHLMRELARIWGNVKYGTNELARDDARGESEVQSYAWDLQTNTRTDRTFISPHARMKQGQRQILTDLGDITNNNNNVAARAVRECISNVLPRWFTEEAQDICHRTLEHGEGEPLPERVEKMVDAFRGIGITEKQIETKLGKKRGQWDAGDVAQMGIAYTSITRDNLDKTELFPPETGVSADELAPTSKEGDPDAPGKRPTRTRKTKADREREQLEADVVAAAKAADSAEGIHVDGEATANAAEAAEQNPDIPPPPAEPEPAPERTEPPRTRSKVGEAAERRLFALLGQVDPPLEREDRILVYRDMLKRPDITSTNDLDDVEIGKLCDQLYDWTRFNVLDDRIRDAVNNASIAEENAKGDNAS